MVIDDVTPPVIPILADVIGECSATAVAPTTTDACAGSITGTTTDDLTYLTQGTYVITWNFDDGAGNSIDVAQNVIVDDVTAPSATCPDNIITCDGSVSSIGLTDVNDNCTIPTITYELIGTTTASGTGDASMEIFNPGETTVTYTLDDGNGNSSQCIFTVIHQEIGEIIVSVVEDALIVETEGSYQWINCSDNSIVVDQTESSFTPDENGDYAVIVTQGICSDTSECYAFTISGLDKNGMNQDFEVYPNPVKDFLTINMANENTNVTIKVVNVMGQTVVVTSMDKLVKTNLNVSRFDPGVYLIQIKSDQLKRVVRIIKE